MKIGPQDIVYITGDSGSGKSVLLRAIKADLGEEAIDLSDVALDVEKPLIETVGATVEERLGAAKQSWLKRCSYSCAPTANSATAEVSLPNRQTNRERKAVVAYG
jgi:ABC-type glutathione transport system ATPase component